jgi:mRNA-degrading endonuclease toxin of MazEF toxin-antitoxin module
MRIRQWDIWKSKPAGFERAHWFAILSAEERLDSNRPAINGLACYTLRGKKNEFDVALNGVDGFDHPTVCQCDYVYPLDKRTLDSPLGSVGWERQQQIKGKLKEVFRL